MASLYYVSSYNQVVVALEVIFCLCHLTSYMGISSVLLVVFFYSLYINNKVLLGHRGFKVPPIKAKRN